MRVTIQAHRFSPADLAGVFEVVGNEKRGVTIHAYLNPDVGVVGTATVDGGTIRFPLEALPGLISVLQHVLADYTPVSTVQPELETPDGRPFSSL